MASVFRASGIYTQRGFAQAAGSMDRMNPLSRAVCMDFILS